METTNTMNTFELSNLLSDLAKCVQAFHKRFGTDTLASRQELLTRIPIQDEEVRELEEAINNETPERIASEATDVLFVAIGTNMKLDPSNAANAIQEIIDKNDAKTWDTHHINKAGKIVRR